jgi:tetratricopeptide (TPR) repeat protein
MFLHQDDARRAHDILRMAPGLKRDPWLLAGEIALASAAERTSYNIKHSMRVLDAARVRPFHLSELASAVGTLEMEHGNRKKGRRLLQLSLKDPTENAIAQVAWLVRKVDSASIEGFSAALVNPSPEGSAWTLALSGEWANALQASKDWLADQAFSSRPAIFGSYTACVPMEEYESGMDIAKRGVRANPHDFSLLNNYAFAAAQAGRLDEAKQAFARIDSRNIAGLARTVWLATAGLLLYRSNDPVAGREYYLKAIQCAESDTDPKYRILANLFFALEELRIAAPDAERRRREAIETAQKIPDVDVKALAQRVQKFGNSPGKPFRSVPPER